MKVDRTDNLHPRFYDDDGHEIRMVDYYRAISCQDCSHYVNDAPGFDDSPGCEYPDNPPCYE